MPHIIRGKHNVDNFWCRDAIHGVPMSFLDIFPRRQYRLCKLQFDFFNSVRLPRTSCMVSLHMDNHEKAAARGRTAALHYFVLQHFRQPFGDRIEESK